MKTSQTSIESSITRAISYRLSFSPDRQAKIVLESQKYPSHSHYHFPPLHPREIFNGTNISSTLSTKKCNFAYGYKSFVATCAIAVDATEELVKEMIKHLEISVIDQAAKLAEATGIPVSYFTDKFVFPEYSDYRSRL